MLHRKVDEQACRHLAFYKHRNRLIFPCDGMINYVERLSPQVKDEPFDIDINFSLLHPLPFSPSISLSASCCQRLEIKTTGLQAVSRKICGKNRTLTQVHNPLLSSNVLKPRPFSISSHFSGVQSLNSSIHSLPDRETLALPVL